jgi:hypothetical protein
MEPSFTVSTLSGFHRYRVERHSGVHFDVGQDAVDHLQPAPAVTVGRGTSRRCRHSVASLLNNPFEGSGHALRIEARRAET